MAFRKEAADAPSKGLRSLHVRAVCPQESLCVITPPSVRLAPSIAASKHQEAAPSITPCGPQHHSRRSPQASSSLRTVLSIIPGDAAGPHLQWSLERRDRLGEDEQEEVEIAAEEVPVPTLHHSRLVMMGRVPPYVRAALVRRRSQPGARDSSAQNSRLKPSRTTMSGLIFYDFGESFSFSRDFTDIPPPPNPATFHHVDVPIIERNYSSEDDSNVIRNPSFTADGQRSWLAPMNVDQTPAYAPVQDPLSVPPNVLRDRHRTGRPRSNSARQPAHAMAYHPYSPPSSPELPADVPLPPVRHSWPPRTGRVTRGLVPYPPSDASSRDSSPERPSWRARGAAVFGPTRRRGGSDASNTTAALIATAPSAHTPLATSTASSASALPPTLAAPATPTIPRRRRKRSNKQPPSDLDVVVAGMSALGMGDLDADVDDLVRSMRTMRLKTRRARRRVAN
ncbi:hypothetical protein EV121DRAFT_280951 [Schizophyllum commune]